MHKQKYIVFVTKNEIIPWSLRSFCLRRFGLNPQQKTYLSKTSVLSKITSSEMHETYDKRIPYRVFQQSATTQSCIRLQLSLSVLQIPIKRLPGMICKGFYGFGGTWGWRTAKPTNRRHCTVAWGVGGTFMVGYA